MHSAPPQMHPESLEATAILELEHNVIQIGLLLVREMGQRLLRGEPVSRQSAAETVEFLRGYADERHHAKEERVLFPALEEVGIHRLGGPLEVLLHEHDHGRTLLAKLNGLLPAIEDSSDARAEFGAVSSVYTGLLAQHICKENHLLFPKANHVLGKERDVALVSAYRTLERTHDPEVTAGWQRTLSNLACEFLGARAAQPA